MGQLDSSVSLAMGFFDQVENDTSLVLGQTQQCLAHTQHLIDGCASFIKPQAQPLLDSATAAVISAQQLNDQVAVVGLNAHTWYNTFDRNIPKVKSYINDFAVACIALIATGCVMGAVGAIIKSRWLLLFSAMTAVTMLLAVVVLITFEFFISVRQHHHTPASTPASTQHISAIQKLPQ
jgi:hypothetical protein